MISIITFTMGRPKYLMDLINSVMETNCFFQDFEHLIFYQGIKPTEEENNFFNGNCKGYPLRVIKLVHNYGPGIGSTIAKDFINKKTKRVMRADDDCILRSPKYLSHVIEISNLIPNSVFSPFPVGLINNLGGSAKTYDRFVKHGPILDTYYTFRPVNHVGGFARICPIDLFMECNWPEENLVGTSGNEDGYFSNFVRSKNIPMYYLENALIVEHNESTLGQHERYKEYFKDGRF